LIYFFALDKKINNYHRFMQAIPPSPSTCLDVSSKLNTSIFAPRESAKESIESN
jgi:hypothetical protein